MSRLEQGPSNGENHNASSTPYRMEEGYVYDIRKGRRAITAPQDFSMFDSLPGIAARRAKRYGLDV